MMVTGAATAGGMCLHATYMTGMRRRSSKQGAMAI